MIMNPGKDQRDQDGGWKVHDRAHLLLFTHTLCDVNLIPRTFSLTWGRGGKRPWDWPLNPSY